MTSMQEQQQDHARRVGVLEAALDGWKVSFAELERLIYLAKLQEYNGNRTHTAAALGVTVRTLQRKLKQWGSV